MFKNFIVISVIGFFFATGVNAQTRMEESSDETVFCAQDAMLCPDGSYVGRTGPNCEFVCPETSEDLTGTSEERKGNVEYEWKVEEGETSTEGDPDRPLTQGAVPNSDVGTGVETDGTGFVDVAPPILINAVEVRGWDPEKKEVFLREVKAHAELNSQQDLENFAAGVLLRDENVEFLSLNFGEIKMNYKMPVRFLGIFGVTLPIETTVTFGDGESGARSARVKVKFPWYSFLYKKHVSNEEIETEIGDGIADLDDWTALSADGAAMTGGVIVSAQTALFNAYDKSHRLLRGTK